MMIDHVVNAWFYMCVATFSKKKEKIKKLQILFFSLQHSWNTWVKTGVTGSLEGKEDFFFQNILLNDCFFVKLWKKMQTNKRTLRNSMKFHLTVFSPLNHREPSRINWYHFNLTNTWDMKSLELRISWQLIKYHLT